MATGGLKQPNNLAFTGNVSTNYKEWIRAFEIYAIASGINDKSEKVQCNVFLHVAGPEAQKIHATFDFEEDEVDKIAPLTTEIQRSLPG